MFAFDLVTDTVFIIDIFLNFFLVEEVFTLHVQGHPPPRQVSVASRALGTAGMDVLS